jgi:chemotaxis family two-component system response regulator Rcp1
MAQKSPSGRDAGKTIHLLLVEDSHADVLLIRESLRSCSVPVDVTVAEDGARALWLLSGGLEPDLVILDLNIPRISGLELLMQYEQKDIPVVVFSSSENPDHRKQALELGARDYVHKPIDLEPFKRAVCDMVEKWSLRNGNGVTAP